MILLPQPPASFAMSPAIVHIQILSFKGMASLAEFLIAFLCSMGRNSFWQRTSVVLASRIKQSFGRPSLRNSVVQSSHSYAVFFGKFCNVVTNPVYYGKAGISFVARLILPVGPSAIRWLVVSVYVDSVQRHSRRSRSHVVAECLEGIKPSLANHNSSSAIVGVCGRSLARAANDHHCPSAIKSLRRFRHVPFPKTGSNRL